jgi:hypothetical protein
MRMRRFAQIGRQCLAFMGMFALALAFLPGVVCVLNVAAACCTATMCPMHNAAGSHMSCGMDMSRMGAAVQTCGCHSAQYTGGGSIFDRVTPSATASEPVADAQPILLQTSSPSVNPEVALPPPRLALG